MTRPDGDNRGFPRHARAAFAFLEQSGFRVADEDPWCVRYESPRVVVSILYGSYDYEIDVELAARGTSDESKVALRDIAAAAEVAHDLPACFQASDERGIDAALVQLSDMMKRLPANAPLGDAQLFRRARELRAIAFGEFLSNVHRSRAEAAWQIRDDRTVVAELKQIAGALSPAEEMKLEIARRATWGGWLRRLLNW